MTPYMGRDFEYEYYVVKDPNINAFALPGGKIVVNTGAIMAADSEAEIAGGARLSSQTHHCTNCDCMSRRLNQNFA